MYQPSKAWHSVHSLRHYTSLLTDPGGKVGIYTCPVATNILMSIATPLRLRRLEPFSSVPTKYLIRPTRKLFGLSLLLSFSYLYYTYQLEATHNALVNKLHHTWSGKYEKGELEEYAAKVQATGMQVRGKYH